jgi:hypothetical protein
LPTKLKDRHGIDLPFLIAFMALPKFLGGVNLEFAKRRPTQQISIQAGMKIPLHAGTGTVTLDPSGVTIQGLLVRINQRSPGACGK